MKSSAKNIRLTSVDDLFSTEESRADEQREKVQEIPLSELHPFPNHAVLFKERDFLEQDVPLASLGEIIAKLEQEISEGRLRNVYALRLGYVCYLDENSPDTYTLYPAWICDCIYAESPKQEIETPVFSDAFRDNFCYEQIVIDAQTCELQASWIAEDDGLYHKEPITWDDL